MSHEITFIPPHTNYLGVSQVYTCIRMGLEPAIARLDEHLDTHALSLEILNHLRDPHSAFMHWRARNINTAHVFESLRNAYK